MFCEECGNKLPDGAVFCTECGTRVKQVEKKAPSMQQVNQQLISESNEIIQNGGEAAQGEQIVPVSTAPVPVAQNQMPMQNVAQNQMPMQNVAQNQVLMQNVAQNQMPMQSVAPRKPMKKITKILLVEAALVLALGAAAYTKVKDFVSPERTAKEYFVEVMAGDSAAAYEKLNVEESDFVNSKYFEKIVPEIGCENISNYAIAGIQQEGNAYTKQVYITYHKKEDEQDYTFVVNLEKSQKKKWLFFDDWKVNVGSHIQKDVTVSTIPDAKVSIDGKEISQANAKKDEYGYVTYSIPKMFDCNYEVKVTSDMYEDSSYTIQPSEEETSFYVGTNMPIKQEVKDAVSAQAQKDFQTLWKGIAAKAEFSSLDGIPKDISSIQEDYQSAVEDIAGKKTEGIKNISFDDLTMEISFSNDDYDEDIQSPRATIYFTGTMDYTRVSEDWWDGSLQSNKVQDDSYSGTLSYIYQDGAWVLQDGDFDKYFYY